MRAKELRSFIELAIEELGEPLFIWGPPGVGKSAIVKQVAAEKNLELIDLVSIP